jgi:hypothetical protein
VQRAAGRSAALAVRFRLPAADGGGPDCGHFIADASENVVNRGGAAQHGF